ncbi:MAG: IS66 family insertion sequence element accessory protein TnpB, partial [Candidatus Obscuribacterales bacterium]
MIAPNNMRVFLCTEDTDMRKSFSALCGLVRRSMSLDPLSVQILVTFGRLFWKHAAGDSGGAAGHSDLIAAGCSGVIAAGQK